MSSTILLQGFGLGLSMIIPIGAQNAFVLNQGIRRHHHVATATICFFCDVALILLGVFGGGAMLASNKTLLSVVTLGGVAFLLTFAFQSIRRVFKRENEEFDVEKALAQKGLLAVVLGALAVTVLNPHVYLDTVVVLGSIGGQFQSAERIAFAIGTVLASFVWFYGIALGAAKMSPILSRRRVRQVIDVLVAGMMIYVAFLLMQKWTMFI
ncbi:LysE/ArgO family amino acid transporter [Enterovibrio nigricans]|uniref:L-lysine exporter family protein LysE/ArgO n=1 Tax=Enterovibrio nigricans DSM 22720 TaxID=1121868 RepID=A0A1T4TZR2_9GAMM|nr:LysE/ArgO family amino acid transporter [Enterovibrio nigricans]PKF51674.1 amino acid transporter [Enterovibrio nigricans]SKA45781.1 L-lysine exporter family protein LysE/ArgO [Enterovibrio nigricans DSM 22720]